MIMEEFIVFDFSEMSDLLTVGTLYGFLLGGLCVLLCVLVYIFRKIANRV